MRPKASDIRRRLSEPSLTALLVVQAVVIFVLTPASAMGLPASPSLTLFILLLFTSITIVMAQGCWAPVVGAAMLAFGGLTAGLQSWFPRQGFHVAGEVTGLATFLLLAVVILRAIFAPGRFTVHRIRGAVVFYLNFGLLFAFLHRVVAETEPGSYSHLPSPQQSAAFRAAIDYLSFATLTSIGSGDIVPVMPAARALCVLEAAVGQLMPTILIAHVVSMTVRRSNAPDS